MNKSDVPGAWWFQQIIHSANAYNLAECSAESIRWTGPADIDVVAGGSHSGEPQNINELDVHGTDECVFPFFFMAWRPYAESVYPPKIPERKRHFMHKMYHTNNEHTVIYTRAHIYIL